MHQVIVLIVLDQQRADAPFAHAQSFYHRDHHPGNGEILAYDLEDLVRLADNDHLIEALPPPISQGLTKLEFLCIGLQDHRHERRGEERYDTEYQQRKLKLTPVPGQQREDEYQTR